MFYNMFNNDRLNSFAADNKQVCGSIFEPADNITVDGVQFYKVFLKF